MLEILLHETKTVIIDDSSARYMAGSEHEVIYWIVRTRTSPESQTAHLKISEWLLTLPIPTMYIRVQMQQY